MDDEVDRWQRMIRSGKILLLPQQASIEKGECLAEGPSNLFSDVASQLDPQKVRWWVKVVEMGQQNWAIPLVVPDGATALFVSDTSGVFDRLDFANSAEMTDALKRNGFEEHGSSSKLKAFLAPPAFPLEPAEHPNGRIYSLSRFWRGK